MRTATMLSRTFALLCLATGLGLAEEAPSNARAFLVQVPLPITGSVDLQVKEAIDEVISRSASESGETSLVIEFVGAGKARGSEFERAYSLARYLASHRLNRIRTVAYISQSVQGHATLVAMACEQCIVRPDAEFGNAGIDEPNIDVTIRSAYREIAGRRRTIPVPVALAMLDSQLVLSRVTTSSGLQFVLQDELVALQARGVVLEATTLCDGQRMANFTGRELRLDLEIASHEVSDRAGVANALGLSALQLETMYMGGVAQHPVLVDLNKLTRQAVLGAIRTVDRERENKDVDLLCLRIESGGGSPAESAELIRYLMDLSAQGVRTVVYVQREARGDAGMIGLYCDQLIVHPDAVLGGDPDYPPGDADRAAGVEVLQALAAEKQKHWSPAAAMLDPTLSLLWYTNSTSGARELLCPSEVAQLDDADQWEAGDAVVGADQVFELTGRQAHAWGLAQNQVSEWDQVRTIFGWKTDPVPAQPTWADELVLALADQRLGGILLFVASFALIAEISSPGIGIGGFVSAVCFMLFFWSNFLNGTADWLEVLMFLTGVSFILLEIFVLPGFGLFGLGGGALTLFAVILATQTFIVPQNAYELQQLPRSLWLVAMLVAGLLASILSLRHYAHHIPILGQIVLRPPEGEDREELTRREALVDYDYLIGQQGNAATRIAPSGKALFGDKWYDVITDGDVIEEAQAVQVVAIRGNSITVRAV